MANEKPPRQSIRTLARKAVFNRYNMACTVSESGEVVAGGWMRFSNIADWCTTRTDAGSVRVYDRHNLMFTFGPDA